MLSYKELVQVISSSASKSSEGIMRKEEKALRKVLYAPGPLKVITGMRRSGKSFLFKRLYHELLQNYIPEENILFLNFEDDRLQPYLSLKYLRLLYDLFMSETSKDEAVYLFLDEIQLVDGWESFVRRIYDSTSHRVFITGSNAKLLSREFSSALGGRLLEYNLYPFSFREMLEYLNVHFISPFERGRNHLAIDRALTDYLSYGGLTEVLGLPEEAKINYRRSLMEKIIVQDIINRYRLHSAELLWQLLSYIEKNTGHLISYRRIGNAANASEHTVEQYMRYLEQTYILHKLRKFSWKTKSVFSQQKKFYFTDNIFAHYADPEDQLENVCFQHVLRRYGIRNVYLGRDDKGKEVDFIVKQHEGGFIAIQVCSRLHDDNLKRETASLQLAGKYLPDIKKVVVYRFNMLKQELPGDISFVAAHDFLLDW